MDPALIGIGSAAVGGVVGAIANGIVNRRRDTRRTARAELAEIRDELSTVRVSAQEALARISGLAERVSDIIDRLNSE